MNAGILHVQPVLNSNIYLCWMEMEMQLQNLLCDHQSTTFFLWNGRFKPTFTHEVQFSPMKSCDPVKAVVKCLLWLWRKLSLRVGMEQYTILLLITIKITRTSWLCWKSISEIFMNILTMIWKKLSSLIKITKFTWRSCMQVSWCIQRTDAERTWTVKLEDKLTGVESLVTYRFSFVDI